MKLHLMRGWFEFTPGGTLAEELVEILLDQYKKYQMRKGDVQIQLIPNRKKIIIGPEKNKAVFPQDLDINIRIFNKKVDQNNKRERIVLNRIELRLGAYISSSDIQMSDKKVIDLKNFDMSSFRYGKIVRLYVHTPIPNRTSTIQGTLYYNSDNCFHEKSIKIVETDTFGMVKFVIWAMVFGIMGALTKNITKKSTIFSFDPTIVLLGLIAGLILGIFNLLSLTSTIRIYDSRTCLSAAIVGFSAGFAGEASFSRFS